MSGANESARKCLLCTLGLALAGGCTAPQPYVSGARLERGLVIVLTGTDGRSRINEAICKGLNDGGVNWAIELRDWTIPLGFLQTLRGESRNREVAAEIAERIVGYHKAFPGCPVVLVGQSGGGGFAPWVLAALPAGHKIRGAILLGPPLSPGYRLDEALANTTGGVVNFYSQHDWFLLGLGTTITGNMDGKHGVAAGKVGFETPADGPRVELYRKLLQVPWRQEMAVTGHTGQHLTIGRGSFVAKYVAPFVLAENWDDQLVGRVLKAARQRRDGRGPTSGAS